MSVSHPHRCGTAPSHCLDTRDRAKGAGEFLQKLRDFHDFGISSTAGPLILRFLSYLLFKHTVFAAFVTFCEITGVASD